MKKILEKTMDQMPRIFTSQQFGKKAAENGYPKDLIKKTGLARFIRIYAENDPVFIKTWTKREKQSYNQVNKDIEKSENIDFKNSPLDSFNVESIISYLKSKGYKIMKPKTDWEEC